jgi:hypothetical protein
MSDISKEYSDDEDITLRDDNMYGLDYGLDGFAAVTRVS